MIIPVLITGIWKVVDPKADFWFFRPVEFSLVLITDENSYVQRILPRVNNLVNDAVWYWVMDGSCCAVQAGAGGAGAYQRHPV